MDGNHYRNAVRFLDTIGLKLLSETELVKLSEDYNKDLLYGLEHKPTSLQMLQTSLVISGDHVLPNNKEVLVIEIGGTNLYAARVIVGNNNSAYYEGKLGRRIFKNTDDFFSEIISQIDHLLSNTFPYAIAIIYSFPGKEKKTKYGIDILSPKELTKDFIIPEIEKEPVGLSLINSLKKNYEVPEDIKIVVLNDTLAVLFAQPNAYIGGVLGTGFNVAIAVNKKIYNTESGGFSKVPTYEIAEYIDNKSNNPGKAIAEKQISGLYLGQALQRVVEKLEAEKILIKKFPFAFTAKSMSVLLQNEDTKLRPEINDNKILKEVAMRLSVRSAQIVGTMIGTIIKTFPQDFIDSRVSIPIEGSVFWGIPQYVLFCKKYAEKVCWDKSINFVNIENAGIKGAARAALLV